MRKRQLREVARECWLKSGGDIGTAQIAFRKHPRVVSLDPMTVIAMIQIAITLWRWWSSMKISEPSIVPTAIEPIEYDADEEDDRNGRE